jgi:predicted Zn-dependent peptidase
MAFKGTKSRSAKMIAEAIESVGGDLNASTGLDTTAYFARVLAGDETVALELIADILLNSKFSPEELDKERVVIQQEIAGADDSPDDMVFDLMQGVAFPSQAIGRPILGTKASVGRFRAADLTSYLAEHYLPEAIVVSAAGAVHHDRIVRHVEALFGRLTGGRRGAESQAQYQGGFAASAKPFEQSHVLIGLPSPSCLDRAFYTAQVFSGLFGGGMSSRLFQEIREDRGLCYSIYSTVWGLRDTGMLAVHAATGPEMVEDLAGVVAQELTEIAEKGPTEAELQRSKAQLKAGLLMALESSSVNAEQMARQLLAQGRLVTTAELIDEVARVDCERVKAFAGRLLNEKGSVAVVGSGRRSTAQAARVAERFAVSDARSSMANA